VPEGFATPKYCAFGGRELERFVAPRAARDIDGLIALLVYTRGDLHHFADNPNRVQPSLFAQNQFEGISSLMRFISRWALMTKMMAVNNSFPKGT
jgi:hypothetical protein